MCAEENLIFVGPSPETMTALADKAVTRALMSAAKPSPRSRAWRYRHRIRCPTSSRHQLPIGGQLRSTVTPTAGSGEVAVTNWRPTARYDAMKPYPESMTSLTAVAESGKITRYSSTMRSR
ncbi:hypothetical protein AB0I35_30450 [Nocardia sp. NPDC050378]|uniref:hypothetical protein n=1 Tax=Nocardia sp. NPDC050378 TaxID=3155400 RepID=UPI00340C4BD3